jgi:hypothetical protein
MTPHRRLRHYSSLLPALALCWSGHGFAFADEAASLAEISHENVRQLRSPKPQPTPEWARKVIEEKIRVLKERAERSYRETGLWYYVKHDNGDCGDTVWWDEVSSDRVYVQLQGLMGGIEKLPNYSPENHRKAIAFWQGWQDGKTGLFHNPFFVDPQNPAVMRETPGYKGSQYRKRPEHERVVQKYVPNLLKALGAKPLHPVLEERKVSGDDVASTIKGLEKALIHGARGQRIGNQVTRQLWVMAEHADQGEVELVPHCERLMSLLLRRFDARTGLLGSKPNFADYNTSANNVKCFARIVGYLGLENYPHREAMADSLAHAFQKKGVSQSGAIRNWTYLSTLALQQTDHRSEDLFQAIETLVRGFENGGNPGYAWMTLSTATAWLHWDIADCEAFPGEPSVSQCYNGVNRPYRSVVGPFGRWVNFVPRLPEETHGHDGFSWDKHGLRARNLEHAKRQVIDVLPASATDWTRTTDGQGGITFERRFALKDVPLQQPHLKAKWKGEMEIRINGIPVRTLSGDFPDYCGLRLSEKATQALRKGENVLSVRLADSDAEPVFDLGLIDWVQQ